jgi:uncharacterized protein
VTLFEKKYSLPLLIFAMPRILSLFYKKNKYLILMKLRQILQQALALTDIAFQSEKKNYRRIKKAKTLFYCLTHLRSTQKWFAIIESEGFQKIIINRPLIYLKPFRAYMSSRWDINKKIKVLSDTYEFSRKSLFLSNIDTQKNAIDLFTIISDNNETGQIKIGHDYKFRKEGEFVISFHLAGCDTPICEGSFCFEKDGNGKWRCLIGCIQSMKNAHQYDYLKAAQKQLFGIRPKSFMLFLIQEVARSLGCSEIWGVGNSIQSHKKTHLIHISWLHKIKFDYDKLWEESNGIKNKEGWYILPLVYSRKEIKELDTSKRLKYRKRYQLLDYISNEIFTIIEASKKMNLVKSKKNSQQLAISWH